MSNTLITPSVIAKQALMVTENNLVAGALVHRDLDNELAANIGDTITVRKPATFTAQEWTSATGWSAQNATEGSVAVKLEKLPDVSFEVTSKELALSVKDFTTQLLEPACRALAQYIDAGILKLAKDIPHFVDVSSTPVIKDLADIGAKLSNNKAPMDLRRLVLSPTSQAKYIVLDAVLHAEKSGATAALRDSNMGKVLGLDTYMDQNVDTQVVGTLVAGKATGTVGDTTIDLTDTTSGGTIKAGQLITIAGDTTQYVVTADKTATTTSLSDLPIYPALAKTCSGAAITVDSGTQNNIAFHRNAFCLATRALPAPLGGATGAVMSYNGLSIRVVYDYDIGAKSNKISLDMLCGFKTLDTNLACRLMDS